MATIRPVGRWVSSGVYETKWSNITSSDDVIVPEQGANLPDKTIYVTGTISSGTTIALKGSNLATASNTNSASFRALSTPLASGDLSDIATGNLRQVLENPLLIGPTVCGSGASTDITVIMVSRGG